MKERTGIRKKEKGDKEGIEKRSNLGMSWKEKRRGDKREKRWREGRGGRQTIDERKSGEIGKRNK